MIRHISALVAAFVLSLSSVACVAESESGSEQTEAASASQDLASRSASFETFTGVDGKTYWSFVAANGENVLRSQAYSSAATAKSGIDSLLENGLDARRFDMRSASNGEAYFVVTAANGEIIGVSQFYSSKDHADRGARTVRGLVRLARKELRTLPAPTRERFEIFSGEDGATYFQLRAANGEVLLSSDAFDSADAAKSGIDAVKAASASASSFQVFSIDAADGWGVRLADADGKTIASGESYTAKSSATRAVARIVEILSDTVSVTQE